MNPAEALAASLAKASRGTVRAVVLYGSQLLKTRPDQHSAFDFVVVVTEYRDFYAALKDAGELHRPVWLMASLARVLAPNSIAFAPDDGRSGIAKCQIISTEHFEQALGPDPSDHFLLGRLVQRVETVWAAGEDDAAWVRAQLEGARARVLDWMLPYMDDPVDAVGLGRRLARGLLRVPSSAPKRRIAHRRSSRLRPSTSARSSRPSWSKACSTASSWRMAGRTVRPSRLHRPSVAGGAGTSGAPRFARRPGGSSTW